MIGALRYRAKIEKQIKQSNGRGGWTTIPQDLGEIWVSQYRMTERTVVKFRQAGLQAEHKFMCRYNTDIDENTRMTVNGRKYEIETIELPIDRTDYMSIYAVEEMP